MNEISNPLINVKLFIVETVPPVTQLNYALETTRDGSVLATVYWSPPSASAGTQPIAGYRVSTLRTETASSAFC